MLVELVAVCWIVLSDGEAHHKRGHQNYFFEDFICSEKNLPVKADSCGKVKEFLESPPPPPPLPRSFLDDLFLPQIEKQPELTFEALAALREFYTLCCEET